jgi:hypothetical protein
MCSTDRLGWYSRSTPRSLLCGHPVKKEPMSDPGETSNPAAMVPISTVQKLL